ncbi:MAG: HAMP domain-containing histidine kinase [Candidatus Solibacter usitatus]|nr:HAMP domain-containing histidine kinase [Candidatus Solibacter usitatus]
MTTGVQSSAVPHVDHEVLLRHLAHEIRQPLSGIESIAYYLDMVLGDAEPEIQQQCERLRRMVQQANWLLEDASLAMRVPGQPPAPAALADILTHIGSELALHEERNIELILAPDLPPAHVPGGLAYSFCEHLLSFFRLVGQAQDPIQVELAAERHGLRLSIGAQVLADVEELERAICAPQPGSGIRSFVEAAGGELSTITTGDCFSLSVFLPAAAE